MAENQVCSAAPACLRGNTHVYLSFQKTLDDLQAEEDKVNHLTKSNSKLSTQIHEVMLCGCTNSTA